MQRSFEMNVPGFQYCGPGTKTIQRFKMGQRGVNRVDYYCMLHDLEYGISGQNANLIRKADEKLIRRCMRIRTPFSLCIAIVFKYKIYLENKHILSPLLFASKDYKYNKYDYKNILKMIY